MSEFGGHGGGGHGGGGGGGGGGGSGHGRGAFLAGWGGGWGGGWGWGGPWWDDGDYDVVPGVLPTADGGGASAAVPVVVIHSHRSPWGLRG